MQNGSRRSAARRAEGSVAGVSQLAAEVVARLVRRDGAGHAVAQDVLVGEVLSAVISADPHAFEALRPLLRRSRVTPAILSDLYIPEVARRLGAQWEEDCVSFAEVSMGVARLQGILREIGARWVADQGEVRDNRTLLLILPAGEQHTLGAMVLSGRLRRLGISVCLRIAPTHQDLARIVRERSFDAAMISLATLERLEGCRSLVKTLKDWSNGTLKVAVGGAVVGEDLRAGVDLGADCVTNDLDVALATLGLTGVVARIWEPSLT